MATMLVLFLKREKRQSDFNMLRDFMGRRFESRHNSQLLRTTLRMQTLQ